MRAEGEAPQRRHGAAWSRSDAVSDLSESLADAGTYLSSLLCALAQLCGVWPAFDCVLRALV